MKLDTVQINNLIQGNGLAAEIPATACHRRAFIIVKAVRATRFINTVDLEGMTFWIRKYEIDKTYIDNDWDVCDEELFNSVHFKEIVGVARVERLLANYIDNFSLLDVEWKCDNPL